MIKTIVIGAGVMGACTAAEAIRERAKIMPRNPVGAEEEAGGAGGAVGSGSGAPGGGRVNGACA